MIIPIAVVITLFASFFVSSNTSVACLDEKIPLCLDDAPDFNICQGLGDSSDSSAYEGCIKEQIDKINSCQTVTVNQCKPLFSFNQ